MKPKISHSQFFKRYGVWEDAAEFVSIPQITKDTFLQSYSQYDRTLNCDRKLIISATIVTFCERLIKIHLLSASVRLTKGRYVIFVLLIKRMQLTGLDCFTQTSASHQMVTKDQNLGLLIFTLFLESAQKIQSTFPYQYLSYCKMIHLGICKFSGTLHNLGQQKVLVHSSYHLHKTDAKPIQLYQFSELNISISIYIYISNLSVFLSISTSNLYLYISLTL